VLDASSVRHEQVRRNPTCGSDINVHTTFSLHLACHRPKRRCRSNRDTRGKSCPDFELMTIASRAMIVRTGTASPAGTFIL
jgi:hypothetical protein